MSGGMYMPKKRKKQMNENSVRVIKISKEALFEFIYENFIADQEMLLDVDPLSIAVRESNSQALRR